ncbi:MAG: alpha-galactosidase [bacterium]
MGFNAISRAARGAAARLPLVLGVLLSALCACAPARAELNIINTPLELKVEADAYSFSFHPDTGMWDVWWSDGEPLIRNATSLWGVAAGGQKKVVAFAGNRNFAVDVRNFTDRQGEGRMAIVSYDNKETMLRFVTTFRFYESKTFFTVIQTLANKSDLPVSVSHTIPLQTDNEHFGGFFPGPDPKDVWALENGYKLMYDFFVRVVNAPEPVVSNWNAAYYDRATRRTSHFGFLTVDSGKISIRSFYTPGASMKEKNWTALSSLKAIVEYDPDIRVEPKQKFEGERLYIGLSTEPPPHPSLERFADAVAEQYKIRIGARETPNGWNSWASKYHHAITEENMLENARWAAERLLPFGMNTFQIDDGWQVMIGDWEPNGKFPHGMKYMADRIRKLGLSPGLWIEPFCVSSESELAREHPEWIAPKNQIAETIMPKDWLILDITNPEVKEWVAALFRRIGREWGFKVIKIDFIYFELLAKKYYDPNVTAEQAFREGMRIIREALPEDAFLLAVAVPTATGVGYADGMRLGLDITPDWGDGEGPTEQGTKPMVRNLARRYYLGRRVWINHPDMFYLGSPEEIARWDGSRLTLEEARTYATLSSLEGGIVKIGDTFTGLNAAQTDLLRRVLPAYPGVARPLDLFESMYPEIWHLPIRKPELNYDVVAFFNWGANRRWGVSEPEKEKDIKVTLADLGLDPSKKYVANEFWTGEPAGVLQDALSATLEPRTVRVYSIHELNGLPQFIGSNRHVTQGATDIEWIRWDNEKNLLSIHQSAVPGFKYTLTFYVPDGFRFLAATTDKWPLEHSVEGNFLKVRFVEPVDAERTLRLAFERVAAPQQSEPPEDGAPAQESGDAK